MTSSGTTDGLETYDFDVFTNEIFVQAVFSAGAQTISISEVRDEKSRRWLTVLPSYTCCSWRFGCLLLSWLHL